MGLDPDSSAQQIGPGDDLTSKESLRGVKVKEQRAETQENAGAATELTFEGMDDDRISAMCIEGLGALKSREFPNAGSALAVLLDEAPPPVAGVVPGLTRIRVLNGATIAVRAGMIRVEPSQTIEDPIIIKALAEAGVPMAPV